MTFPLLRELRAAFASSSVPLVRLIRVKILASEKLSAKNGGHDISGVAST